jgi:hypothetical protein
MIHVYAFADELTELPDIPGLDGAPLESRTVHGLDAVISRHGDRAAYASLRSDAITHGTVVEALLDRATAVLPVRFGEEPADEESLARLVQRRSVELRSGLENVRGCIEVGVRILTPGEPDSRPSTGTEYMRARSAAGAGYHELGEQLRRLVREVRAAPAGAAYLVPRANLAAVQSSVQRFAESRPHLTVVCTGPWAPYSFVPEPDR